MVQNYQEERALAQPEPEAARLATVYDWWSDGLELIFDGETQSDGKHYPCNANHWFSVGDRVLVQKVGGSYVVICKIGGPNNDDRYRVANIVKNNAPGIADLSFTMTPEGPCGLGQPQTRIISGQSYRAEPQEGRLNCREETMELKVKNKRMDTEPIRQRFTQGEALVDRPRIVLPKVYDGLDISGYAYEIRAVSDKYTMVRRPLEKAVEGDDLVLTWTVTGEFTAVSGPLTLTVVGVDEAGNEIIKLTSEKIIIREDPDGAYTAPPPNLMEDALRQMAVLQAATNAAREAAEAARVAAETARVAAETARDTAGESAGQAADSAAEADASKVEAEKVLENTQGIEDAIRLLADQAQHFANLAQQYAELASTIAYGQKGYFETPEALKAAHPEGESGWWAVVGKVGSDTRDSIWLWDSDTHQWIDSGRGTDLTNYPQWAQLGNKLLVPCTCAYDPEAHLFALTRKDVNQVLADGAELTFRPQAAYTWGDMVEFEGQAVPLEYAGSPVDVQSGAWLANRPAKLIWYADNEQGGEQNGPLRSRRKSRT